MLGKELKTLSELGEMGSLAIAPAGVSSYKLIGVLQEAYPQLDVECLYDSYRLDAAANPEIRKIDQIGEDEKKRKVVVVTERELIRKDIVDSLHQAGMEEIFWIGNNFSVGEEGAPEENMLYFFYDLSVNALNYEFVTSLAHANSVRVEQGLKTLHPVIVPQTSGAVLDFTRSAMSKTAKGGEASNQWFLHNVIAPSTALLPEARGITICGTREEAKYLADSVTHVFPEHYQVERPVELNSHFALKTERGFGQPLSGLDASRRLVGAWLVRHGAADKKCVVITLRKCETHKERNSDMVAWKCFAAEIRGRGYVPIFINDAYACFDAVDDFLVFDEAAMNIFVRMSLYEAAYLNMSVNNGPMIIAALNPEVKYLSFVYVSEEDYCGSKQFFESAGEFIGYQYEWATQFQRNVWGGGDSCKTITAEFDKMCELIERSEV